MDRLEGDSVVGVAKHDGDPRPRLRNLGYAMVVGALTRAAHHDEVAAPRRPTDAGAATLGSDPKRPALTERNDRNDGLWSVARYPVAMLGDAVSSIPIQVAGDPIELHLVLVAERFRHLSYDPEALWELITSE